MPVGGSGLPYRHGCRRFVSGLCMGDGFTGQLLGQMGLISDGQAIFFKLVAYVWRFSCRRKAWLGVLCSRPSRAQSPKGETSTCRTRQLADGCWTTTSKSKIKIKKVLYAFCTQHLWRVLHFVSNTFGVRASPTHENKRCLCNLYPLLEFESQKVDLCILYPTRVRNT